MATKIMKHFQEINPNWIELENYDIRFCVIFYRKY